MGPKTPTNKQTKLNILTKLLFFLKEVSSNDGNKKKRMTNQEYRRELQRMLAGGIYNKI